MSNLDHDSKQGTPPDGGEPDSTDAVVVDGVMAQAQVRTAIAAGLRLVAEGIVVIADALASSKRGKQPARAPRRIGLRLPPEPTNSEPSTDAELAAAARAARRAGILVD